MRERIGTWLLPVRDGEPWLARAVESVLREADGHPDELLVVDDGSAEPVRAAGPLGHPLVRILRQSQEGIVAALEHGRREARGAVIFRIDADDLVLPGRRSVQLRALSRDARLGAVGGSATLVDPEATPEGMRTYVSWVNGLTDPARELLVEATLYHPASAIRASALDAVGGWRGGDLPEDYDLWLRLARAGWGLGAVQEPVLGLRDHEGRLTRTDPRYRRDAFEALKREHLARVHLRARKPVALWAGREGRRRWLPWLRNRGCTPHALIDPFEAGRERGGLRVRGVDALGELEARSLLLVAVGRRGARELIRAEIRRVRPDWREGLDWLAVL